MNAQIVSAMYSRLLAIRGTLMTLKRTGVSDLTFRGFMTNLTEKDLVGEAKQGDRSVILGTSELVAAGWSQPIRPGDKVVCQSKTYTVQTSDPIALDGTTVRYNLIVRG